MKGGLYIKRIKYLVVFSILIVSFILIDYLYQFHENYIESSEKVVSTHLEALSNNDIPLYQSTLWQDRKSAFDTFFLGVELSVISVNYYFNETPKAKNRYINSDLAQKLHCSSDYVKQNFAVVSAEYQISYDNTLVPNIGGHTKSYFYLIRNNEVSSWYIGDYKHMSTN